jgi:hypothetical protein
LQGEGVQLLYLTVLRRAIEIKGGEEPLAKALGVGRVRVTLWKTGRLPIPEYIFMALVDVVLRDDVTRAAQDRRQLPRPRTVRRPSTFSADKLLSLIKRA